MKIRSAKPEDKKWILEHDKHVPEGELERMIPQERVVLMEEEGEPIGWMRYNMFWDNTPFLNMICFLKPYRRMGLGSKAMDFWEEKMRAMGFHTVMTSTASDEDAQHFYQRRNYEVLGAFRPEGEPAELVLAKKL